jgi:replicative DNA helicase
MKVPPQNIEAEEAVIGGILIDNEAAHKVMEFLTPEDFYRGGHQTLFEAIVNLYQKSEAIDLVTLTNHLQSIGSLDRCGGASYVSSLVDKVPSAANIGQYGKIVREKALLRRLLNGATSITEQCFGDVEDVEQVLDEAEKIVFDVAQRKISQSFYAVKDIVKDSFKTIEQLYERKEAITGVPAGYPDLDKLTSGLQPSDLIIVAGRPSMGKTAFALNIVQHAALEYGKSCAVFSLEMSKEQLVNRLLCSEGKVNQTRLRGGFLSESDWPKLTRAAGALSEATIFIDDTPALNVLEMRAKARRLQREKGLDLIVVDYLQLMRGIRGLESREREISEISRSLKALAKELQVPVVALSQLNRGVEARQDKRPQLADLRESGAIEQDADVIMFVYRDEMYNKESPDAGIAEIIIGKQRNGPTGAVRLAFIKDFTRFEALAQAPMQSGEQFTPAPPDAVGDDTPF